MFVLFFILFCSFNAVAIEADLSGKTFIDTYFSTQGVATPPKSFLQQNLSLWLQGDLKFSEKFSARAIYQGDYFDATNSSQAAGYSANTLRSTLREFYWQFKREGFSVREGKQIISWGKSDGLNPTDFLSAKDYTFLNPDDEIRRLAGTVVYTTWTPDSGNSPLTFELVTQFIMPKGKSLIPQERIPTGVVISDADTRPISFDNTEYALKTTYNSSGWDLSFSFFRGFDHQPEFREVSRQSIIILQQYYSRIFATGFDFSKSYPDWVLRLEGAYFHTENPNAQTALSKPSHFDFIVGAEKPLWTNWRLNFQMIMRYFPNFKAASEELDPISRQIAQFNSLLKQYVDKTRPSTSVRLAYEPEASDFSSDVFLIYNFEGADYLLRPQVKYKPIDNLKLTVGSDYYGGDQTKPLGSLKAYNSIYFEAQYYF
ncbi:MAG: hypothetical protein IPM57_11105 [Oligoflexia bacterium]|nr:hypothetical protein [Oligoflexia bacterium]